MEMRGHLQYFESDYSEHCREEERAFQLLQTVESKTASAIEHLLDDHERFAVDLDRFQRQIASYQQSGDPTVLLAISGRMIPELDAHFNREDSLFAKWISSSFSNQPTA